VDFRLILDFFDSGLYTCTAVARLTLALAKLSCKWSHLNLQWIQSPTPPSHNLLLVTSISVQSPNSWWSLTIGFDQIPQQTLQIIPLEILHSRTFFTTRYPLWHQFFNTHYSMSERVQCTSNRVQILIYILEPTTCNRKMQFTSKQQQKLFKLKPINNNSDNNCIKDSVTF